MYNYLNLKEKIHNISSKEYPYFFNKANVIGVGFGHKIKNGFYTCTPCITVFVNKKLPKNTLYKKDLIPNYYKEILTDIVEINNIHFSSLTKRIRPVLGGYSIGPSISNISGTIGCLVTDGPNLYLLSNNHTLSLINKAPIGTPILQPSVEDKGKEKKDIIAHLSKFIPLIPNTKSNPKTNIGDCAIAEIVSSKIVSSEITLIGYIKGIKGEDFLKVGLDVEKIGRTTEKTLGKITNTSTTIRIYIESKEYVFTNQICSTKMSTNGDSGAILLDSHNFALGLLFGSNNTKSFFTPIKTVLTSFGVSIVTG